MPWSLRSIKVEGKLRAYALELMLIKVEGLCSIKVEGLCPGAYAQLKLRAYALIGTTCIMHLSSF